MLSNISSHTITDKMQITNPRYCHGFIVWCWACHSLNESDGILQSELRHQTSVSNPSHSPLISWPGGQWSHSSTQSRCIKYPGLLITSWVNQIQSYTDRIYIRLVSIFNSNFTDTHIPKLIFSSNFRQREDEPFISKKQSNATIIQDKTKIATNGHKFNV